MTGTLAACRWLPRATDEKAARRGNGDLPEID